MRERDRRSCAPPPTELPEDTGRKPRRRWTRPDVRRPGGPVFATRRHLFGPHDLAEAAHARHLRRQLAQAAEHGAALLAAIGLPRLVEPDFVPLDPVAIGEALESTIAALDAMDGDPEAEPWLGWTAAGAIGAAHDAEHDTADAELDLGWAANHSQLHLGDNTLDGDLTALERHGRGFVRSGPDDAEEDDPLDDDRTAKDSALRVWVFGPSRREGAHA